MLFRVTWNKRSEYFEQNRGVKFETLSKDLFALSVCSFVNTFVTQEIMGSLPEVVK